MKKGSKIIWWIVGFLFIILSTGFFSSTFIGGALVFLAGLFVLPPVQGWIVTKYNFKAKTWMKVVLLILVIGLASFFMPTDIQPSTTTQEANQDTQETNQEQQETIPEQETPESVDSSLYLVTRVIDGDTIEIQGGERVRLICIDTPETNEYYYQEATDYLEGLILNKEVELVKDKSETDRYNRLLRYIYLDGLFVNEKIVRQGYGKVYPYSPDTTLCPQIQEAETEAKNEGFGIWAETEQENQDNENNENYVCTSDYYNCGDFSSCFEVMAVFNACGSGDIHGLDGDDDGTPCESLC